MEKGDIIGKVLPPVPAHDGVDVRGRLVAGKGSAVALDFHETVSPLPDDPNVVSALISGSVSEKNHLLKIEEALRISGDVSFQTGNINSTVDVHVSGRVPDRFAVKSQKSITVGTSIEAASVTAEGDVTVRQGIVGRNTGLVSAGGDIITKHASEANLVARGNLKIARQLMNSQAWVGGKLEAPRARVIGGRVLAEGEVEVAELGSNANVPTLIVVGVRPWVIWEVAALDQRVRKKRELIKQIRKLIKPLLDDSKPASAAQREQLTGMMNKTREAEEAIFQAEKRRKTLLKDALADDQACVRVSGTIHPKVSIRVADQEAFFHKQLKGPLLIDRRKVEKATELVVVNPLTSSVTVLQSMRHPLDELVDTFELPERT